MPAQPFTPQGVADTVADLYQLTNEALRTQADLVRDDLRTWVTNNFSLSTTQQTYLDDMDDRFIAQAACQTGFALENRLTITLAVSGTNGLKLVRLSNDMVITNDPDNGFSATGGLTYNVEYQ